MIRIIGEDRMIGNLNQIVARFEDKQTARFAAEIFKTELQSRAPRGRTLNLYDSVDIRDRGDHLEIGVDDEGFYGYFLERGTSKMAPRPWFQPSFDAGRRPAVDAITAQLNRDINQIWGR